MTQTDRLHVMLSGHDADELRNLARRCGCSVSRLVAALAYLHPSEVRDGERKRLMWLEANPDLTPIRYKGMPIDLSEDDDG